MALTPDEEARIARLEMELEAARPMIALVREHAVERGASLQIDGGGSLGILNLSGLNATLLANALVGADGSYYYRDPSLTQAARLKLFSTGQLELAWSDGEGEPLSFSSGDLLIGSPSSGSREAEDIPVGDTAVAASTVTQLASVGTLAAGVWVLFGWACFAMGATGGTAVAYFRDGTTRISGGQVATLAASAVGSVVAAPTVVVSTGGELYNLAGFASQATTAKDDGGGLSSLMTGMRAVRLY